MAENYLGRQLLFARSASGTSTSSGQMSVEADTRHEAELCGRGGKEEKSQGEEWPHSLSAVGRGETLWNHTPIYENSLQKKTPLHSC